MSRPAILQNAAHQIADKLSTNISPSIIEKTMEQMRVLETRVKTGSLGKSDRKETRAAVLLEMTYRQETGTRLNWKELVSAVGMKKANLEQLQTMISNYLQKRTSLKRPLAKQQKQHRQQQERQSLPEVRRSHRKSTDVQRLDALAIRLSDHLMDPHGSCRRARQLLMDIQYFVDHDASLSASDRRGMKYDLKRYEPAYEAAALYHVTGDSNKNNKGKRSKDEEDAGEREMTLVDLADASAEFTYLELKQVLPQLIDLGEKVAKQRKPAVLRGAPAPVQDSRLKSSGRSAKCQSLVDKTRRGDSVDCGTVGIIDDELPEQSQSVLEETDDESSFSQWREKILGEAIEKERTARLQKADNGTKDKDDFEDDDMVDTAMAADNVLRKYGLLPT